MEQQTLTEIRDLLKEISEKLSYRKKPERLKHECRFDLMKIYRSYPRKEGKTKGFEVLAREIQTDQDYELLLLAVKRYAEKCLREKTEAKFVLLFSSFAGRWRDYLPLEEIRSPLPRREVGLLI